MRPGYYGVILDINLTTGKIQKNPISTEDSEKFIGGRGLGAKILWDRIKKPGLDALSPENPLLFMLSPFSGFPVPSSPRMCVVTKSPRTSAVKSEYRKASTINYSNMGGFFGPEIKFAGYDGIAITGKASSPVYIVIEDDKVQIRDAGKFWGMRTDKFDREFIKELGDKRFKTCYIGPAGEKLVEYACIIHTAARTAGRGGTGCVMGSKNLKAIAVKGTKIPEVFDHKLFLEVLEKARKSFKENPLTKRVRDSGTTYYLTRSSGWGMQVVKNFREGTFSEIDKIGDVASKKKAWVRDFACYCCPLSCKKSGFIRGGPYAGMVHDGPEYEAGTMLGANLLVSDLAGLLKEIYAADDLGLDNISTGNIIGFLMEAYEKGYIDKAFLDGIDLKWGNVDAILKMIEKIANRDGVGDLASKGVKALSKKIGRDSERFAIHVKGMELAGWNVHASPGNGISYATSNRGACHLNGWDINVQNTRAMFDTLGFCIMADFFVESESGKDILQKMLFAITGIDRSWESLLKTGERVFNLEKMFNYREGFRREDDSLPERFFTEPLTVGPKKGAVLTKGNFNQILTKYYQTRGWDPKTTRPTKTKLESLGLSFTGT